MKIKIYLIVAGLVSIIALNPALYADGPIGGSMGGGGMMGGQHGGMMGNSPGYTSPRGGQTRKDPQYPDYRSPRENETMRLRGEIQEKRQKLSNLYRSETPDKELIDQKIKELSRLESDLDQRLSNN